ncbi:hypothetical protein [Dactylosporangium sp. CA-233914]|uniref:hypothetical protein n=1 Tax=Dactylosporangium sp. CA-233914 TaxID=3239934 RepID=UPI003D8AA423
MRRWSAAASAVAIVGVGTLALTATPAWAADPLEIKVDNSVQGKVGDKVTVRFVVKNNSKQPVEDVTVLVQAPSNAVMDPDNNPGCAVGGAGRGATCRYASIAADKSAGGQVVLIVKSAGQANGRVSVEHGNADNFALRATGGPSATASSKSPKPTRSSGASASAEPTIADDGTFAPPQAGNGVAIEPTTAPTTTRTGGDGGGLSTGLWVGIAAIVGALGLIGSLFWFRRKDRNEPETGMQPAVPAPGGFPMNYGPAQPTTYGTPATPTTYGSPAAGATQMIPPVSSAPPPGPTQIIPPGQPPQGGGDQTVMFKRPDDF